MFSIMALCVYLLIGLIILLATIKANPPIKDHSAFDLIVMVVVAGWPFLIIMYLTQKMFVNEGDEDE